MSLQTFLNPSEQTLRKTRKRLARQANPCCALVVERLEDRLALSGFGPEDGAYIVEPRAGAYTMCRFSWETRRL